MGEMNNPSGLIAGRVLGAIDSYVFALAPAVSPSLDCIAETSSPEAID
jgi:hypothetical protein